ncbi:HicB-like antitoxin [Gordonia phage Confidence]|nr:HicB-like antitoxin [Gordonia phage Confidence]
MSVETIHRGHPHFSVSYSNEDQEWVATTPDFPSLSWLAAKPDEAIAGLARLIETVRDDVLAERVDHFRMLGLTDE